LENKTSGGKNAQNQAFYASGAYTSKLQATLTKPSSEFIVTMANPRAVDDLNTRVELGPDKMLLAASLFHSASTGDKGKAGKGL
jgi:LysM repeat protein